MVIRFGKARMEKQKRSGPAAHSVTTTTDRLPSTGLTNDLHWSRPLRPTLNSALSSPDDPCFKIGRVLATGAG